MAYHPEVSPNPFLAQATWFVDPQNVSGNANDNNTGIDALHPVRSYNGGVAAKWGTNSPVLRQNTSLVWMSDALAGDSDGVIFTPIISGGAVVTIQGALGAAQLVHAGVLAGVIAKNKATGQLLTADVGFSTGGFYAGAGMLVKNTTGGKVSFAWSYLNTVGTTFEMSQPLIPAAFPNILASVPTEVDTWANGDTIEVYVPVRINLVRVATTIAAYDGAGGFPDQVNLYQFTAAGTDTFDGDDTVGIGNDVAIGEVAFNTSLARIPVTDAQSTVVFNCFISAGTFTDPGRGMAQIDMYGGVVIAIFGALVCWNCSRDTILDGSLSFLSLAAAFSSEQQHQTLGSVYVKGFVSCGGIAIELQGPLWGPATVDIAGTCRAFYASGAGAAVATFLNAGLTLNGQATAYAIAPTDPAIWHPGRTISAVGLDTPVGPGNTFGGLALNPGGASITNQGTA